MKVELTISINSSDNAFLVVNTKLSVGATLDLESERKKLILEIERWVEKNPNPYAKAAFYSDDKVAEIVEKLYIRWQSNGFKGMPLDYATIEELRILASKALEYRNAGPSYVFKRSKFESKDIFDDIYRRAVLGEES